MDVDELGRDTLFGTRSRNIPEEVRAMEAGLAPGMVRQGLRLLREFIQCLEAFMNLLGLKTDHHRCLLLSPCHIVGEVWVQLLQRRKMMDRIHKEFQPGGLLYEKLDDSTPFRRKGMEQTVRGRSWAIYDGVYLDAFDEEWESPTMYRMLGKEFKINTFPDQIY